MILDREFARDFVKSANGDGSKEAKFNFLKKCRGVVSYLSCADAPRLLDSSIKIYGRCAVAACVAATILNRKDRVSEEAVVWSAEVMKIWRNRVPGMEDYHICDNLHPSRIDDYTKNFRDCLTE